MEISPHQLLLQLRILLLKNGGGRWLLVQCHPILLQMNVQIIRGDTIGRWICPQKGRGRRRTDPNAIGQFGGLLLLICDCDGLKGLLNDVDGRFLLLNRIEEGRLVVRLIRRRLNGIAWNGRELKKNAN